MGGGIKRRVFEIPIIMGKFQKKLASLFPPHISTRQPVIPKLSDKGG
jgi:hypothetical protein